MTIPASVRDDLAARRAELNERLVTQRRLVSAFGNTRGVTFTLLPHALRKKLADCARRAPDEVHAEPAALAACEALLHDWEQAANEVRARLHELREVPKLRPPRALERGASPLRDERLTAMVRHELERVLPLLRDAQTPHVVRLSSRRYGLAAVVGGAPIDLSLHVARLPDVGVRWAVRSSVPMGLSSISVVRQTRLHELGKLLHLVHELELRDQDFDDRFFVSCPRELGSLVFDRGVRAALCKLPELVSLHVGAGRVRASCVHGDGLEGVAARIAATVEMVRGLRAVLLG